ncbi:MAG: mercury resistance system transport protein MerF [Hyphomicrobiales bacterium]
MEDATQSNDGKMLKGGIAGSFIAAVCCFTPILVYTFLGVGLSAYIGGIDYVVFPVMFTALGVTAYALYLQSGCKGISPKLIIAALALAFSVLLIWLEFKYALRISLAAVALVAAYGYYLRSAKSKTQTAS